jgi:hypothetical protein
VLQAAVNRAVARKDAAMAISEADVKQAMDLVLTET